MSDTKRPHVTILHSLDDVPVFMCEIEEAAFWETHELDHEIASEMDDMPETVLPLPRVTSAHLDENTARREN
jgi:hypothetical protein